MPSKQAKRPIEMSPEVQKTYDAFITFLAALSITAMVAIGMTIGYDLATPITHLEPVSPFAVFGLLGFLDLTCFEIKNLWGYFHR